MSLYADRTFKIDTENAFKIGPQIAYLEGKGYEVIKLNLGEPDFDLPDYIKNEIKRQIDLNQTHYCDPKGILPLRKAVADQIYQTRQIKVSPEQVVVFPGAKPGIGLSQQVYCNPGDEIIYPSPGFPIYESFINYIGAIPKPIHLVEEKDFTFYPEQLEELITSKTKMIFLNFPSNPTGGVATKKQLESIAEVILKKCNEHVRVYSDEIYEYILFDGSKHVSIAQIPGMEKRTIISSGFSKTFSWTGGRIGYCVFPTVEEADIFKNLNINYFSCIPAYNQQAAREAYENPIMKQEVHKMVSTFEERRNVIVKAINEVKGFSCKTPSGAFYLFPNIHKACETLGILDAYQNLDVETQQKTSPSTLFQLFALYHHQVACMDRKSFGKIGSAGKHYLRLSIAASLENLQEGVKRLHNAVSDIEGFKRFIQKGKHLF